MDQLDKTIITSITKDIENGRYSVLDAPKGKPFIYITVQSLTGWRVTVWEDGYINPEPYPILPNLGEVATKAYRESKQGDK